MSTRCRVSDHGERFKRNFALKRSRRHYCSKANRNQGSSVFMYKEHATRYLRF